MTQLLAQSITMDDLTAEEEYITAAEFEDATRTVVRTLGKNFDLDIIFAGNGAKTDGGTVILPAQDPTKLMTKKQYAVGQGFANHETMHNLCSDMPHFISELKRLKSEGKKLAIACANAIEDVRIERAAGKLYPGIPHQIASTADYAAKMFMEDVLPQDTEIVKDFKRIGPVAITWRGRQRLGYDSPYIVKALNELTPEMLAQVDKWCDLIDKLDDGADGPGMFDQDRSFDGSRKGLQFAELLAKEIEEMEDEEEEDDQNGGQQGAGGNGNGGGGQGGGGGTSQNHQGHSQSGGATTHGKQPQGGASGGAGGNDPVSPDMDNAVMQLLQQGNDKTGWRPVSTALDVWVTRENHPRGSRHRSENLTHPNNLSTYHKLSSEVGGKTAVMKRKFERALLTASEADYVSGQRSGRLDVRKRGVQIMQGKENIFRKKMDGQSVDTAVSIVVDASGSMCGERMELASQVCIALAECLEKTTVELEIVAFRADEPVGMVDQRIIDKYRDIVNKVMSMKGKDARAAMFHRYSPVMMFELKSFDDSLREARVSLGCMPYLADGSTPDGDAILKAATRLMANKRKKKIMLVLTDGGSGYGHIQGNCTEYTKMAIDHCIKNLGINMIGVGIQSDHGKHLYKNWTVVNDLGDLDKAIIDNIARMILGENFKVDNADVTGASQNYKRRA